MVASERRSKTTSRPLRAVSVKEKAHADHASQMVTRLLIPPASRLRYSLAPSVTTPLYRTSISKALRGAVLLDMRGPRGGESGSRSPHSVCTPPTPECLPHEHRYSSPS